MAADWTHHIYPPLSCSVLHELSCSALTSHLAGCAVKKILAKNSILENNGFRIVLRIQDVEMLRWYVRPTSSDECHHHHPHRRCAIVEKGVTSSSQHQPSQVPLDGSWRCGQPFKDSPSSTVLNCHHTSHAGDAAGSTRFSTACIEVDSWTPFCRTPAELLLFRQQIAVMLLHCCCPLDPVEGPGGCRCPLRLPHTYHTSNLYRYLLQWCPPAVSGGSNSFLSFTHYPSVILLILSSPVPKASSVRWQL